MSEYPRQLIEKPQTLPDIPQAQLNARGLYVVDGLDVSLAAQLIERSLEPHIVAYCPGDSEERFKDIQAVEEWQAKGRLTLPLVRRTVGRQALVLAGFGWMGPSAPSSEEGPTIPDAQTTFAMRIYQEAVGQGNALPYTLALLAAHNARYGNKGVWLEAWADNFPAIKTYQRAGFRNVAVVPGIRSGADYSRIFMVLDTESYD